jgi:argininosuccinate lyase
MKTKLWQKENSTINKMVECFTIGNDNEIDLRLAKYDVIGSLAHVKMLNSIGIVSNKEFGAITDELKNILEFINVGDFKIETGVEDVHSQIELMLTTEIGDAAKKIHTGRSRNDQVLLDIKLYLKDELKEITKLVSELFDLLISLSNEHKNKLLPGYTHLQIAMPSSFGLWFGAYAESLTDDMEMIIAAYNVVNKNPLGSGAGYGSSFSLNRKETTELLDFETLNYNSIYAQMTRGKTEKIVSIAMAAVASTLSKLAYDVCLYLNQNFDFITFPDELTTGSSIMPHKKNPDIFELTRAKCNRIQALPNELTLLINNLPSGYHRDMQLSKEILFPALTALKSCLSIITYSFGKITVNENILDDKKYENLFSVERVNELVKQGISFRDAYKITAEEIDRGEFSSKKTISHTHEGSIGDLCNTEIEKRMKQKVQQILG